MVSIDFIPFTIQFMHELGHNFGSGHTHETTSGGYDPIIDTCGQRNSAGVINNCPAQLPLAGSSTIMSYCNLCSGGAANIKYTFGGKYISGPRSDK